MAELKIEKMTKITETKAMPAKTYPNSNGAGFGFDEIENNPVQYYNGFLYHGTKKIHAQDILENNFKISTGEELHLGKGVYFYDNETFAAWWMLRKTYYKMPNEKLKKYISESDLSICEEMYNIFKEEFGIIIVKIENAGYLDLDNTNNKILFFKIFTEFMSKRTQYFSNAAIYDQILKLIAPETKFDMVGFTTNIYELNKTQKIQKVKLPQDLVLYKIYCVKSIEILKKRKELNITRENIENCLNFMI
ncbi:hypothetical protein [Methanolapillus millepedarum]|uniref:Uncharacterized protein n=1 Tax=Methanolapillus millepedarum TaxID=3028296 RepID=A0AA96V3L8_9EURY|nr:hypothetical protein MsAc7_08160 [Methanosarcinaceae archaeon Ac7]